MQTLGEFLREKREARGMSLREAAKAAAISHVHIKDIEEGKKSPSFDKVMNLLKAYMADVHEFLRETGYLPKDVKSVQAPKIYKVPLVSWVAAEKLDNVHYGPQHAEVDEWIGSDIGGTGTFALRVQGDSMEPEFRDGDIIIVNPLTNPDHNDYIVLKNTEDEAIFKQFKKYGKARILHPLNPNYPDIELSDKHQYRIIGKVVEKKKRY